MGLAAVGLVLLGIALAGFGLWDIGSSYGNPRFFGEYVLPLGGAVFVCGMLTGLLWLFR